MNPNITKLLKMNNLGDRTIAFKKLLSTKAISEVRSSFKTIKKQVVDKHINESKRLAESSVYDSIRDYAKNSSEASEKLPKNAILNLKFDDKSSLEVTPEDARMMASALSKIAEPVVKQQLITQMDLSAGMFNKAKAFLKGKTKSLIGD